MNTLWQDVDKIADKASIGTVERMLDVVFPHLYLETIKKFNAGSPVNNVFDTEKTSERVFSNLLSFNLDKDTSILTIWEDNKERMPNGIIPFATDPGGNYICFDYRSTTEPSVVFWNHEENFVINAEDELEYPEVDAEYKLHDIEFVAPNFFEFLSILYKKEEVEEDFSDFEML
jgi:hypothetical protein